MTTATRPRRIPLPLAVGLGGLLLGGVLVGGAVAVRAAKDARTGYTPGEAWGLVAGKTEAEVVGLLGPADHTVRRAEGGASLVYLNRLGGGPGRHVEVVFDPFERRARAATPRDDGYVRRHYGLVP